MPSLPTLPTFPAGSMLTSAELTQLTTYMGFWGASPPVFLAYQASGQSIASGFTGLAISLGTPQTDTYTGWSATTPTRYTAQTPGWYWFLGGYCYPVNSTGSRIAQIQKNGSTTGALGSSGAALPTSSFNLSMQASGPMYMNGTGDYVEMWGYQDSGSTLTTVPGSCYLAAFLYHG